jgi:integrase
MFTTHYGSPIDPRNFNRTWEARIRKAGVFKITVHDGRRTSGSLLADLDVHPRVAMHILRHAQFSITMEISPRSPHRPHEQNSNDSVRASHSARAAVLCCCAKRI